MLQGTGKPIFTRIYDALGSSDMDKRDQYLRGDWGRGDRWWLETLAPHDAYLDVEAVWAEPLQRGAIMVFNALANECGAKVAYRVFGNVTGKDDGSLWSKVTRGDLELLHQELQKKPPQTFTQIRDDFKPGVFGIGEGEYLHAEHATDLESGQVQLRSRTPSIPNGSKEKAWASLERQEGVQLVKQAMVDEYGFKMAEAVLRKVREEVLDKTGRLLDEGMTRGDLELLHNELHTMKVTPAKASSGPDREGTWRLEGTGEPTFTQIHDALSSSDMVGRSQHLLGKKAEGDVWRLNTFGPETPDGIGGKALTEMLRRGASLVFEAMAKEYGFNMAYRALWNVTYKVHGNGITLWDTMTCSDVNLLHEELQCLTRPLQELRGRVATGTTEVIKDELASNWASAADEEYYKMPGEVGPIEDVPKKAFSPVQWPDDAKVVGLRSILYSAAGRSETYAVKEKYHAIQWPDSDAKVGLRDAIHTDHLQGSQMQFDEKAGTLTLTRGALTRGGREENKKALTKFIAEHFEVEPGHPAFPNIANNILSYLPRGPVASAVDKMLSVDRDAITPWDHLSRFTLSVKDENVVVAGETRIPYEHKVIPARSEFVRHEAFEISGEHLTVDPTAFDAKANLGSVNRYDAVEDPRNGMMAGRISLIWL
jgi:hypothetical protein